jgi:hypothetical protein
MCYKFYPITGKMSVGKMKNSAEKLSLEDKAKNDPEVMSSDESSLETAAWKKHDPHSYSPFVKALCIGTVSFGEFIM